MLRRLAPSVAVVALLLITACASEPEEGRGPPPPGAPGDARGGPPGAGGRAAGCGALFVSPAGEPFRAEPDAAVCPLRAWFTGADADGDGALSRTEFRNDALRFFAVLDTDGDGYIDALEVQAYEHLIAPEILGRGGGSASAAPPARLMRAALQGGFGGQGGGGFGGGQGGGGRGHGGGAPPAAGGGSSHETLTGGGGLARFGLLGEPEPVAASDLDLNDRITRVEFATRSDQRFHSLDEAETGRLLYADLERRLRDRAHERRPGGRGAGPPGGGGGGRGRRGGA